jgi:hypothetical protein
MVLGVSLAAAGIYTALVDANFWPTVAGIFTLAGAIYTFIIQRFEGDGTGSNIL